MAKSEVVLCDICDDRRANQVCDKCGADLCVGNGCSGSININIERRMKSSNQPLGTMTSVILCNRCLVKTGNLTKEIEEYQNPEFAPKVKEMFVDYITKKSMLNKLEYDEEPSDDIDVDDIENEILHKNGRNIGVRVRR